MRLRSFYLCLALTYKQWETDVTLCVFDPGLYVVGDCGSFLCLALGFIKWVTEVILSVFGPDLYIVGD